MYGELSKWYSYHLNLNIDCRNIETKYITTSKELNNKHNEYENTFAKIWLKYKKDLAEIEIRQKPLTCLTIELRRVELKEQIKGNHMHRCL